MSGERVLLIQEEWPARSLLKAELEEDGREVLGADTIATALSLATARGFRPDVIVLDTVGLSASLADVEALQFLRGSSPLILLLSTQQESPLAVRLQPSAILHRPFTVGDVVAALGPSPKPNQP